MPSSDAFSVLAATSLSAGSQSPLVSCRGELDKLDIHYRHPVAKHGIVAEIGSGSPRFALRTDMDALPIEVHPCFVVCPPVLQRSDQGCLTTEQGGGQA